MLPPHLQEQVWVPDDDFSDQEESRPTVNVELEQDGNGNLIIRDD